MEVYHNGEWGTVCDDGWDSNDAKVVCNQLGIINGPTIVRYDAFYGQGSGRIWLNDLKCTGTEVTIQECSHRGWGTEKCSHSDDAGVKCFTGNFWLSTL